MQYFALKLLWLTVKLCNALPKATSEPEHPIHLARFTTTDEAVWWYFEDWLDGLTEQYYDRYDTPVYGSNMAQTSNNPREIVFWAVDVREHTVMPEDEVSLRGPFKMPCNQNEHVLLYNDRNRKKGMCASVAAIRDKWIAAGKTDCLQVVMEEYEDLVAYLDAGLSPVEAGQFSLAVYHAANSENTDAVELPVHPGANNVFIKLPARSKGSVYRVCAKLLPGHGNAWLHIVGVPRS